MPFFSQGRHRLCDWRLEADDVVGTRLGMTLMSALARTVNSTGQTTDDGLAGIDLFVTPDHSDFDRAADIATVGMTGGHPGP